MLERLAIIHSASVYGKLFYNAW